MHQLQTEREEEVSSHYLRSRRVYGWKDFRLTLANVSCTQRIAFQSEVESLSDTISKLASQVSVARAEKEETDREQEDLLVLLEDLSIKRKNDKRRMRIALMDVSEDEDGDDEDEDQTGTLENGTGSADGGSVVEREIEDENVHPGPTTHTGEGTSLASRNDDRDAGSSTHGYTARAPAADDFVYGEESAVFRGGEYDAQPFEAAADGAVEATGWSPNGYEYSPRHDDLS